MDSLSSNGSARSISPTVLRIANGVRQSIRQGDYPAGSRLPSEAEIARLYDVSRIPVRLALDIIADEGYLERAPRCRPLVRLPETGSGKEHDSGQSADMNGVGVRSPRVRLVLYWSILNVTMPANAAIQVGIQSGLDPQQFRLAVETACGAAPEVTMTGEEIVEAERQALERFAADPDIEGVILWATGTPENMPAVRKLREAGKAIVFVDRVPFGDVHGEFPVDYVGVDNLGSAKSAVRHLIDLGHRRIAHVTNNERVNTVWERAEGYRLALEEAGLPFDPSLILPSTFDDAFLDTLLDHPNGPATAIFAVNDWTANQTINALLRRSHLVPEQVSIVGFDGNDYLYHRAPFLTTAVQPLQRVGSTAAQLLIERLDASPPSSPISGSPPAAPLPPVAYRHILLEAPLAVHGSTRAL